VNSEDFVTQLVADDLELAASAKVLSLMVLDLLEYLRQKVIVELHHWSS